VCPLLFSQIVSRIRLQYGKVKRAKQSRYSALGVDEDQRLTFGQRLRRLFAGAGDDALDRAPGYAHPGAGFFLGQAFEIAEPQGLQLITVEVDLVQLSQRSSGWFEGASAEVAFTVSEFLGPWGHIV
jgi:hypothetical protein